MRGSYTRARSKGHKRVARVCYGRFGRAPAASASSARPGSPLLRMCAQRHIFPTPSKFILGVVDAVLRGLRLAKSTRLRNVSSLVYRHPRCNLNFGRLFRLSFPQPVIGRFSPRGQNLSTPLAHYFLSRTRVLN